MTTFEIYHSNQKGENLFATSRTRKAAAIKIAENISLEIGDRVSVFKNLGNAPCDCIKVYSRRRE